MAVHDNGQSNQGQPQQPTGGQPQQQQQTQQQGPAQMSQQTTNFNFNPAAGAGDFNLDDLIGSGISPLAPIADSAKLTELQQALREVLSKDGGKTLLPGFAIDIVDAATARTKGSAVLVSHATQVAGVTNIAVMTCILEASVANQSKVQYVFNQRTYELEPTAGTSWTSAFWNRVENRIRDQYGRGDNVKVFDVGVISVPFDFDVEDKQHVHNLARITSSACAMCSASLTGRSVRPMNLSAQMLKHNLQLQSRVDFTTKDAKDAVGRPVRADVVISTFLGNQQQQQVYQGYVDQGQDSVPLVNLSGYVDVNYVGPTQTTNGVQTLNSTQHYMAEFVMTGFETRLYDMTMERLMFITATASMMDREFTWAHAMLPKPRPADAKGKDIRDIGILGIEQDFFGTGAPKRIEFGVNKDSNQKVVEISNFLATLFYKELIISIDCDTVGPNSYLTNDLLLAAGKGEASVAAQSRILNACNQLTNGAFAPLWAQSGLRPDQIIYNRNLTLPRSQYVDNSGTLRSGADLDYIARLNLLEKDLQSYNEFTRTMEDPNLPSEVKLATQEAMLKMLWPTAVVTGELHRLTWEPKMLQVLVKAMENAGVAIRPEGQRISAWGNTAIRSNQALMSYGNFGLSAGLFNYGNNVGAMAGPGGFGGRISSFGM